MILNFRRLQETWSINPPTECRRQEIAAQYKIKELHNGHNMASAESFHDLLKDVCKILSACASDAVFPNQEDYLAQIIESAEN